MSRGTALITGASSGIGEALAHQFARNDFDLILVARRTAELERVASDIGDRVEIEIVTADLGASGAVEQLCDQIAGQHIDVLVNNAGIAHNGKFLDHSESQIINLLQLNIIALTTLTHRLLPAMIDNGSGRILNVASVASFQPVPSLAVYAASKAYVLSFTEALSEELRGTGVSTTALCPGLTKTALLDEVQGFDVPSGITSTPEAVAREGYDALMNREVIRIPGIANQAALAWAKHQPR